MLQNNQDQLRPELDYEVVVEKINQILKSPKYKEIEFDKKETEKHNNERLKKLIFNVSPDITFDLGKANYIAKLLNEALKLTDKPKFHARCAINNYPNDLKCFHIGLMDKY